MSKARPTFTVEKRSRRAKSGGTTSNVPTSIAVAIDPNVLATKLARALQSTAAEMKADLGVEPTTDGLRKSIVAQDAPAKPPPKLVPGVAVEVDNGGIRRVYT